MNQAMKLAFLIFGSCFVVCGLAWYFTWAIFVHANASAYGTGAEGVEHQMPEEEKLQMEMARIWARRFRLATVVFLALSLSLAAAWEITSRQ